MALQTPKWLYGTMGFVGTRGAGDFVLGIWQGGIFCLTLCVYTQNTQNFVENSKMDEKHKKRILTLTRPPGRTLADGSLS